MTTRLDELAAAERKLAEAVALAGRPVPLDVAAELLGLSRDEALALGERLDGMGILAQSREGFLPGPDLGDETTKSMGEMRRAAICEELARAFAADGADPGYVGDLYFRAARYELAAPLLAEAGLGAARSQAYSEALPVLDQALEALRQARSDDPAAAGRLYLARAQCHRLGGWSERAAADLELAVPRLQGAEKVDALGWAAQVADDRQRLQEAERFAALGEHQALETGEPAKAGSLLTLHGRILNRLGFGAEARAASEKGTALLEAHGIPQQRFRGRYNQAWVAFDQGRYRDAEALFASLAAEGDRLGLGEAIADVEAWWARALFVSGRPAQGLQVRDQALDRVDEGGTAYVADLALAEGADAFGAYDDSLAAADRVLEFVQRQLPAWENVARYLRGKALLGMGRLDEAAEEAERAVELCPPGIDGRRWRLRCWALAFEAADRRGKPGPVQPAVESADQALQAGWLETACELLMVRSVREGSSEPARDAAALALQIGAPMTAAKAAHQAGLWKEPEGAAVISTVKTLERRVPEAWRDDWRALPWVAPALDAPDTTEDEHREAAAALQEQLELALAGVGLADAATILSPAQRRAAGYVRPRRRRRNPWLTAAAVVAVIIAGGLAGLLGAQLITGETIIIQEAATVVTQPPTIEETPLEVPEAAGPTLPPFPGQWNYRGDPEGGYLRRVGATERSGVPELRGYYWKFNTNAQIRSSPIIYGQWVLIGSGRDLFAINMETGNQHWVETANGEIIGAPVVDRIHRGGTQAQDVGFVAFYGSDAGTLSAREVFLEETLGSFWPRPFTTPGQFVASPLVVDGVVYAASTDGHAYGVDGQSGDLIWQFPLEGEEPIGEVQAAPAYADGVVYVGSRDGHLYGIDALTGQQACRSTNFGGPIGAAPVVLEDRVLVGTSTGSIFQLTLAPQCGLTGIPLETNTPVSTDFAVADGVAYIPSGRFLLATTVEDDALQWSFTEATERIASAPVVAGDLVYVGSDDGHLYAIDRAEGTLRWKFRTGGAVLSSPAVADGAVFFGSTDGILYAVGGPSQ